MPVVEIHRTKLAAQSGQFDAIVVTGLIVDHGVYRHEFVAQSVMDSIMGNRRDRSAGDLRDLDRSGLYE